MPDEEDRIKGGDSDAFKRAAATFGVGEYLYDDGIPEPDRPTPPGGRAQPTTYGRAHPAAPQFPDARAFYRWLREQGYLAYAETFGNAHDLPIRILDWSPEDIAAATQEILERVNQYRLR